MIRTNAPIPLHDPFDYSASGPIEISMAVENLAMLYAIPERKRWIGKTVYVISEEADYRLLQGITNDHWTKINTNSAASEFWECAGLLWVDPIKNTWGFNPFNSDSPNYLPITWVKTDSKNFHGTIYESYLNIDPNKTACMASFAQYIPSSVAYHLLLRLISYGSINIFLSQVAGGATAVVNFTSINIHIRVAKPTALKAPVPGIIGNPLEIELEPNTYVANIGDSGETLSLQFNVPMEQELPANIIDAFTLTGKTFTAAQLTQTGSVGPDTLLLTLNEAADETYSGDLAYDHTVAEIKTWWGLPATSFVCEVVNEIPATFVSAATNEDGDEIVITMSRNMDETVVKDLEDSFTVSGGRTVIGVSIDGTDITLALDTDVVFGEVVTVAFDGVINLLSIDGTDTEAFTAQSVTNNTVES